MPWFASGYMQTSSATLHFYAQIPAPPVMPSGAGVRHVRRSRVNRQQR